MSCSTFTIGPDNSVTFELTIENPITGDFVDDAVVTVDIKDRDGDSITDFPASLSFVADGVYRETFSNLPLTPEYDYTIITTAETPDPLYLTKTTRFKASTRS